MVLCTNMALHTFSTWKSFGYCVHVCVVCVYMCACVCGVCGVCVHVYMCVWCVCTCVCGVCVHVYMCVWCVCTCVHVCVVCGVCVYMHTFATRLRAVTSR